MLEARLLLWQEAELGTARLTSKMEYAFGLEHSSQETYLIYPSLAE